MSRPQARVRRAPEPGHHKKHPRRTRNGERYEVPFSTVAAGLPVVGLTTLNDAPPEALALLELVG